MELITILFEGIFNSEILNIDIQEDSSYNVNLNIQNSLGKNQKYNIQIIYNKENLVVAETSIHCAKSCNINLPLDKIFFSKYTIIVTTKDKNNYYKKEIKFELEIPKTNYKIYLKDKYFIKGGIMNISGIIDSSNTNLNKYYFEIYPKTSPESINYFDITCLGSCEFSFEIGREILFDTYIVRVYSPAGDLSKEFEAVYYDENSGEEGLFDDYKRNNFDGMFFETIDKDKYEDKTLEVIFDFEKYFEKK